MRKKVVYFPVPIRWFRDVPQMAPEKERGRKGIPSHPFFLLGTRKSARRRPREKKKVREYKKKRIKEGITLFVHSSTVRALLRKEGRRGRG